MCVCPRFVSFMDYRLCICCPSQYVFSFDCLLGLQLAHTGAHKINNAIGQALLAKVGRKNLDGIYIYVHPIT